MKTPSVAGESAAIIAVITFIYWSANNSNQWAIGIWILFGILFIGDWMFGGISDKGLCKNCW